MTSFALPFWFGWLMWVFVVYFVDYTVGYFCAAVLAITWSFFGWFWFVDPYVCCGFDYFVCRLLFCFRWLAAYLFDLLFCLFVLLLLLILIYNINGVGWCGICRLLLVIFMELVLMLSTGLVGCLIVWLIVCCLACSFHSVWCLCWFAGLLRFVCLCGCSCCWC